jgi:heat shock protein 5
LLSIFFSPFFGVFTLSFPLHAFHVQIDESDKKTILAEIQDKISWIEENGSTASAEDYEERLAEVQAVVNPITSKIYGGGSAGGDEDMPNYHDEL